jgi:DNA invertase Pin-like site-specific DNA recombinase
MRIAIYSRVSTAKQDTENQLAQLREFAGMLSRLTVAGLSGDGQKKI